MQASTLRVFAANTKVYLVGFRGNSVVLSDSGRNTFLFLKLFYVAYIKHRTRPLFRFGTDALVSKTYTVNNCR